MRPNTKIFCSCISTIFYHFCCNIYFLLYVDISPVIKQKQSTAVIATSDSLVQEGEALANMAAYTCPSLQKPLCYLVLPGPQGQLKYCLILTIDNTEVWNNLASSSTTHAICKECMTSNDWTESITSMLIVTFRKNTPATRANFKQASFLKSSTKHSVSVNQQPEKAVWIYLSAQLS